MAVVAIILGMLAGFGVITAAPAEAATANCTADDNSGTPFDVRRLVVELDGGAEYLDTDADSFTCSNGDLVFDGWTGVLHVSCSEDLTVNPGAVIRTSDGATFAVTDFWLDSRNVKSGQDDGNRGDCQPEDTFPDPSVTLLKVDENDSPLAGASFLLDGDTDYDCTSDDQGICDFGNVDPGEYTLSETAAPDGYELLTLTEEDETVTVKFDSDPLVLGPFVNTPTPEDPTFNPAISLIKTPEPDVEGSDLIDIEDGPPLLQFSDSDEDTQTALYSYLITNEGDEPLENISLSDSRDDVVLDLSACPEVLQVGDSCTATGTEAFDLDKAEEEVADGGLVTNTGTVTATGQESEEEVSASDDATIALSIVFPQAPLEKEDPKPAPDVKSDGLEQPAPEVESAAEELPATGLDDEGLLPLSLLLIAFGGALLWLDRPWVGVR